MIINNETNLNGKQIAAYQKALWYTNKNNIFSLETNPTGRKFVRAKGKAAIDLLVDVDLCEWVFDEQDQERYENETNIIPVKLTEGKTPVWINKDSETGEDEKGWYFVDKDGQKNYRYFKS
jgi:hypothetical protein